MNTITSFNIDCRKCARLATYLDEVNISYPQYHCRPVAACGPNSAQLLIVGLAPGLHGANKTGRPFTGDASGQLLFETLCQYGFANQPQSVSAEDELQLLNCRITNAVKCLPPENKPLSSEISACNQFLAAEMGVLSAGSIVLTLGTVAHQAVLRAFSLKLIDYKFSHAAWHELPNNIKMVNSYHCSRYNLQTKRLTKSMFNRLISEIHSSLTK